MGRGAGDLLSYTQSRMRLNILLSLSVIAAVVVYQVEGKPKGHCKKATKSEKKALMKFTESKKGCPCWWDETKKKACACCKPDDKNKIKQCGYPMHNYCHKPKVEGTGCPGVCNNQYTLSMRGFPCFWDHTNLNCAWCADNGYQCGPGKATGPESKDGSRCQNGRNKKYCDSVLGDCRHIPKYDVNARCMFKRSFGKYIQIFEPRCNPGYKGNGIQCFDKDGQLSVDPDTPVEVKLKVKSDFYQYPHTDGEYPYGKEMDILFKQAEKAADACRAGKCQAAYNQTETNF